MGRATRWREVSAIRPQMRRTWPVCGADCTETVAVSSPYQVLAGIEVGDGLCECRVDGVAHPVNSLRGLKLAAVRKNA